MRSHPRPWTSARAGRRGRPPARAALSVRRWSMCASASMAVEPATGGAPGGRTLRPCSSFPATGTATRSVSRRRSTSGSSAAGDDGDVIVDCAVYTDGKRRDGPAAAGRRPRGLERAGLLRVDRPARADPGRVRGRPARSSRCTSWRWRTPIAAHQRPKLEVYDDDLFVVLKTARYDDRSETVEFAELQLFVGASYVVTRAPRRGQRAGRRAPHHRGRPGAHPMRSDGGAPRGDRPRRRRLRARDRAASTTTWPRSRTRCSRPIGPAGSTPASASSS